MGSVVPHPYDTLNAWQLLSCLHLFAGGGNVMASTLARRPDDHMFESPYNISKITNKKKKKYKLSWPPRQNQLGFVMENRGVIVTTSHSKQWPAKIRGCPVSTAIKLLDWMPLHHLKHGYPLIHIFPLDAHLSIEIQWVLQATVHPPFFSLLPASDHWSKKI